MTNRNELMLESYLEKNGIVFSKIPEFLPHEKPDYFIKIGDGTILCDVKTLEANEYDKERLNEVQADEKFHILNTHKSIRNLIGRANGQFKAFDCLNFPGVLVLVCERIAEGYNVDRETMWEAMFGTPVYGIDKEKKLAVPVFRREVKLRVDRNTHVSAIASAIVSSGEIKSFVVYHNPFARYPLDGKIFTANDKNVVPTKIEFRDV